MDVQEMSIEKKLRHFFDGKIVRKDLTKLIKEGANVPVYVLEYLLGMYCSSENDEDIEDGVKQVKKILADNYVRPDEAQKIISKLRESGSYTVIDKISVKLNYKTDIYEAEFSNLGIKGVPVSESYVSKFERLLCGGIWCIVRMEYFYDEADTKRCPFIINTLTPIQMPGLDINEFKEARGAFEKEEWIDLLLRSTGMEPSQFNNRVKWLHLARLIPLVENNFNLCELGPRGTGKSHVYKEISPNSILVSGGQTTVANLFYNMGTKTVGLVGMWDCVAFDEVAGITFKDKDGVQIMKDYMASGSFARGKEEKSALASMVFVGNINQSVDVVLKTSHLFDPFPDMMANDTAFLDRMHCYIPGWEIPKYRPEYFTDGYGFITDYFAEVMRELRKTSASDSYVKYFKLGNNLNQRDVIGVKKMVSGLMKLLYPNDIYNKEDVEEVLRFALECRRRVKEQLKKIGGMEFYDINFSYIDNETLQEEFVPVPEQGGGKLIPDGMHKPGHLYTVARGKSGMIGVFKLETEMVSGSGKFERTGVGSDREAKEALDTSFRYLKANSKNISGTISTTTKDYLMHIQDLNGIGMTEQLSLSSLVALCSAALNKPVVSNLAILGNLSIGGTIIKVEELANVLQVCLDSGAKKILLPITSAVDMGSVPPELMGKFNLIFYQSPEDAVFKALGVE
nr:protease Lon-related BREX system protein BrxL [uncultured Niameybacter sp.]